MIKGSGWGHSVRADRGCTARTSPRGLDYRRRRKMVRTLFLQVLLCRHIQSVSGETMSLTSFARIITYDSGIAVGENSLLRPRTLGLNCPPNGRFLLLLFSPRSTAGVFEL